MKREAEKGEKEVAGLESVIVALKKKRKSV